MGVMHAPRIDDGTIESTMYKALLAAYPEGISGSNLGRIAGCTTAVSTHVSAIRHRLPIGWTIPPPRMTRVNGRWHTWYRLAPVCICDEGRKQGR